jgi:hypothetical protein
MNKTLLILIGGIVIVAGLIGYTIFGKQDASHMEGDGHAEHVQGVGKSAPHDDTGVAPHAD